jgi:glycosyltransferase involved in cell wall biosynthesis
VLIVSFRAPPFNSPGAVRVLGTAIELLRLGIDVRVVGADDQGLPANLEVGAFGKYFHLVPWWDVNAPLNIMAGGKDRALRISDTVLNPSPSASRGAIRAGKKLYQSVVHVPDGQVGWIQSATREGIRLAKEWRPDVVLGSALPISSLYAARKIATKLGVPWVAEFRDLWTDNHYYTLPAWRRTIDRLLEKRLLSSAAAVVTISAGLAGSLRKQVSVPVEVVFNGIDEADVQPTAGAPTHKEPLVVVHTGQLIPGKRDPKLFLDALNKLGTEAKGISVRFYGRRLDVVADEIRSAPSPADVSVHEPVSRQEALQIQSRADLLLLLLWNHPSERGVVPSKLFEYLGSGRPILLVGPVDGDAARILKDCNAGFVANDAAAIASLLAELKRAKQVGSIPGRSDASHREYLRSNQVRKLASLLHRVVNSTNDEHR